MKHILAVAAAVAAFGFALPSTASAYEHGCRRVVSYLPCGRPVYSVYQVYSYDRCGHPIGRWVTQHSSCSCSVCRPRVPAYHGTPYHGHLPRGYPYGRSYCPTPGRGVSWIVSFGR